jgi:hypothetical protein
MSITRARRRTQSAWCAATACLILTPLADAKKPPPPATPPVSRQVCIKDVRDHAFRQARQMLERAGESQVTAPRNFDRDSIADADGA